MNDDFDDPLLDSCLEEVLGGRTPPDLTGRIVAAWTARSQMASPGANGHALPLNAPLDSEPVAPPIATTSPLVVKKSDSPIASKVIAGGSGMAWNQYPITLLTIALALSALVIVVPAGIVALRWAGKPGEVVGIPAPKPGETNGPAKDAVGSQFAHRENESPVVPAEVPKTPRSESVADNSDGPEPKMPFGSHDNKTVPGEQLVGRVKVPAEPDAEVIAFVNQALNQSWQDEGIRSAPATDAEWCRRVYLRVVGRIPTVDELKRFTSAKSPQKRIELVDELLSGETYREEFATHWAEFLANVLIGRTTAPESKASREGLVGYLRQTLLSGKPYDGLSYELLTATGSGQPGSPDYNGAANFLLASLNEKAVLATTRTSRVFLGKQLQCAQCHHHPSNEWGQNQFWEMNAFFRQLHAQPDRATGGVRLANRDFHGEEGDPSEAEVYYELPNGRMKVAYPAIAGTLAVSRSGLLSEVDRRTELARRVVASEDLARAAVNRLWGHFLGYGFTRPIDDMGPHNPPSHPQILERLAEQFAAHDYRLASLMRWIVLSDAFGTSSKLTSDNLADAPEAGERPLFSRYYTRQMQPEQVYESLRIAAAANKNGGGSAELAKARLAWLGQFTRQMGTDDGEEQNTFSGDIRQSLIMMNGPLMQHATSREYGSLLDRVGQSKLSFPEKVEHLFLAAVSRKPLKRELDLANEIFTQRGDAASALQDIWWALLNSNEFILDH